MAYLKRFDFGVLKEPYKKDPKIIPFAHKVESGEIGIDQLPDHEKLTESAYKIDENRAHFKLNALTAIFIREFYEIWKNYENFPEFPFNDFNELFEHFLKKTLNALEEWDNQNESQSTERCPHRQSNIEHCLEELRSKALPNLEQKFGKKLSPIATNIFRGMYTALDVMVGFTEVITSLYQQSFAQPIPEEVLISTLNSRQFRQQLKDIASLKSSTLNSFLSEISFAKSGQNRSAFRANKFFLTSEIDENHQQKIQLFINDTVRDNFEICFTHSSSDIATKCPAMIRAIEGSSTVIDQVLNTVILAIQYSRIGAIKSSNSG